MAGSNIPKVQLVPGRDVSFLYFWSSCDYVTYVHLQNLVVYEICSES